MLERLRNSYKRTKDANSHYSVLNNAYQVLVWGLSLAGVSGSLAGFVFSHISNFWSEYGLAGSIAVGLVFFFAAGLIGSFLALVAAIGEARSSSHQDTQRRSEVTQVPLVSSPARAPRFTDTMMIAAGIGADAPEFRASFGRNGRNSTIYLRYSYFISGFGGAEWSAPATLTLSTIDRYIKGEIISVPIAASVETPEGLRWFFGTDPELQNGFPRRMIGPNMYYRGCVMIVSADDQTEQCFFIGESTSMDVKPKIIGEHMWEFARDHSRDDTENGSVEALFVDR